MIILIKNATYQDAHKVLLIVSLIVSSKSMNNRDSAIVQKEIKSASYVIEVVTGAQSILK